MKLIQNTFVKSLLFVVALSCWNNQVCGECGKYREELEATFIEEMKREGFVWVEAAREESIEACRFGMGFALEQKGSVELARKKVVFLTEAFLDAINCHEKIRPYLREYPFKRSDVEMTLSFEGQEEGSVARVYCRNNEIIYFLGDSENILKEPYSNALTRLNLVFPEMGQLQKTEKRTITPTRKRLGTLEAPAINDEEKGLPEQIGQLIGGVCDEYFGEEFLEELALEVQEACTQEYCDYWESGQMKARIPMRNGRVEGHMHGWYPDGTTAFKGYYVKGKRVGIQLACYPKKEGMKQAVGRLLEYDKKGRLHGTQKIGTQTMHYRHGALQN